MISQEELERLREVKDRHQLELLNKPNVVGVGIGFRHRRGRRTSEAAIVVSVTEKVPESDLAADEVIPEELEGVPVDVQATGPIRAL